MPKRQGVYFKGATRFVSAKADKPVGMVRTKEMMAAAKCVRCYFPEQVRDEMCGACAEFTERLKV